MNKGMSWQTNEFYLEYLKLKEEIAELAHKKNWADTFFFGGTNFIGSEPSVEKQKRLDEKLDRMKVVLWELNAGGITAVMLLYLSWGIDLNQKKESEGNEEHVASL